MPTPDHPAAAPPPAPATGLAATGLAATGPWLALAGLHGAVAVALGAFAAHGMADGFPPQAVDWVDTASRYQLVHAAALAALASLIGNAAPGWPRRWLGLAAGAFALGPVLFSGALYGLAFTGIRTFGAVAPFGGLALILGWIALAIGGTAWRRTGTARRDGIR